MSQQNRAIVWAYEKGYRVQEDGAVKGIKVDTMSLYCADTKYLRFNVLPPWAKHKIHIKVHRLAGYQKFGKFWDKGLEVDHINNDTKDNRLCNIRVITHAENVRKSSSPFTWDDIRYIRFTAHRGSRGTARRLAEEYGVTPTCIYGIINERTWKPEKIA